MLFRFKTQLCGTSDHFDSFARSKALVVAHQRIIGDILLFLRRKLLPHQLTHNHPPLSNLRHYTMFRRPPLPQHHFLLRPRRYSSNRPVLQGHNIRLKPGKRVLFAIRQQILDRERPLPPIYFPVFLFLVVVVFAAALLVEDVGEAFLELFVLYLDLEGAVGGPMD